MSWPKIPNTTTPSSRLPESPDNPQPRHEVDLRWSTFVPCPIQRVFDFFSDASNLQALTPPWLHFKILTPLPIDMHADTLIDYRIRLRALPVRWRTRISVWEPPFRFIDEQIRGPYRQWIHEHTFESHDGGTFCRDRVRYIVPGGPLAPIVDRLMVRADVNRIFAYRAQRIAQLLGPAPSTDLLDTATA